MRDDGQSAQDIAGRFGVALSYVTKVLRLSALAPAALALLAKDKIGKDAARALTLVDVWPRATRENRTRFEKLKDAYVKARYSKQYRIGAEELAWLGERVEELGRAV